MISEKGLIRAMKNAWKGAGYTVSVRERLIYIEGKEWDAVMHVDMLPRKALALLVEHIGSILKDGEAYTCTKGGGAQTVSPMVVFDRMNELIQLELHESAKKTKLSWGDAEIWQSCADWRILGIDPEYAEIVGEKSRGDAYIRDNYVIWQEGAKVRVAAVRLPEAVQFLSSVQWTGEG